MSGYNWNLRHGNVSGSNRPPPRPSGRTEIACRVCDGVFMSSQALINHIESHIVDDGLTASRLRQLAHQTNINPMISSNPPIRPNTIFPIFPNPFHGVNNQTGFAPPPPPPPPPHYQYQYPQQPQVSPYSVPWNINVNPGVGSHYMIMPSANQTVNMVTEEDPTARDCTRTFLSQLERPILRMNYELDNHGNDNADSDNLDLTLKL